MTATFSPARAVAAARADLGLSTNSARCNKFTTWQTRNTVRCSPFCASGLSYWLVQGGFVFHPAEHVWGDRGDWNVTAFRQWAQHNGLWRSTATIARPSWGVVMNFGEFDQHIGMAIADAGRNVATIEANTGGGHVYARSRSRRNIEGFIAFDQAGQTISGPSLTPQEFKLMGQTASWPIPGAHPQTKNPWNGRLPFLGAILQPNGTTDLAGFNGATISAPANPLNPKGPQPAFGLSVYHLGKLVKPIDTISPVVDAHGEWHGEMLGMAGDGGTFRVKVAVHYL